MPKAKKKKPCEAKSEIVKSTFLYGKPNKEKLQILLDAQKVFTQEVNRFTQLLEPNKDLLLPIVKGSRKDSALRKFEKANRTKGLNSAISQAAFDEAVDVLSSRANNIKDEICKNNYNIFTQSKVLFALTIQGATKGQMIKELTKIAESVKVKDFYLNAVKELNALEDKDFKAITEQICGEYNIISSEIKVPHFNKVQVRVTSMAFKLKASDNIAAPYILEVVNPFKKNDRISIPLNTSDNSLRRLKQYGLSGTIEYTIHSNNTIRVTMAFKKKVRQPDVKTYVGVDVGITDMLYTSEGKSFGTFSNVEAFYKDTVEPSLAGVTDLRNKKRKLTNYSRTHKSTLPNEVKQELRGQIDKLDKMIRCAKTPYRKNNHYKAMQEKEIKDAVNSYISSLNGDKTICTAIELLDIKEFEKVSRKQNQNLSNFARGLLSKTLMEQLNWNGYSFIQVEPAYTSQVCPVCCNLSKENRDGKKFKCNCCGYEADADFVGAINIKNRATDSEISNIVADNKYNSKSRHVAIVNVFSERHNEWLQAQAS